jgi:hypothetical protein
LPDKPAIFGQVKILAEAHRSLAAATAISGLICSTYDCGAARQRIH